MISLGNIDISYGDIFLLILLCVCCYTDLRAQKIYNIFLFPAILIAFTINFLNGGLFACFDSFKGLFLGIALLIIPFVAGGMGAGDVKLLGVIGAFKGPEFVFIAFIAAAIIGGVFSICLLVKQGKFQMTVKKVYYLFMNRLMHIPVASGFNNLESAVQGESFPYALAIGLGVILAYIMG